jgi:hypothetical protein
MEFDSELVSELAALCQQFLGDFGDYSAFDLAIYKYVVHVF